MHYMRDRPESWIEMMELRSNFRPSSTTADRIIPRAYLPYLNGMCAGHAHSSSVRDVIQALTAM